MTYYPPRIQMENYIMDQSDLYRWGILRHMTVDRIKEVYDRYKEMDPESVQYKEPTP